MRIARIDVWAYEQKMRDGPYAMSHVVLDRIHHRILRLTADDGTAGFGEVVFPPPLDASLRRQRVREEPEFLGQLLGRDPEDLTFDDWPQDSVKSWRGITFALETACLDLSARRCGIGLTEMLGSRKADDVADYFSISERTLEKIAARLGQAGNGRKIVQLKVGIGGPEMDRRQILAALNSMANHQTLLVDANGGWDIEQAASIMNEIQDLRVVWEEPCADYDTNARIAECTGRPVMIDQCGAEREIALRAIEERRVHSICIKPAFLGGLRVGRDIRDRCAESGVAMRIDGPWCGDIATAAILALAVGAPPALLIAGCDLREPLALTPDLGLSLCPAPGRVAPPAGDGIGFLPDMRLFGPPELTLT